MNTELGGVEVPICGGLVIWWSGDRVHIYFEAG